jgi:hypothetical protein
VIFRAPQKNTNTPRLEGRDIESTDGGDRVGKIVVVESSRGRGDGQGIVK